MAFTQDSEHGATDLGRNPCISDLAMTALAVIWLQKQPEEPRATCGGSNRRFHEPGQMGLAPQVYKRSLTSVVMPAR